MHPDEPDEPGATGAGGLGSLALARSTLDRAGVLRLDEAGLRVAWAREDSRVLVLHDRRVRVLGDPPRLALVPARSVTDPDEEHRYLLGRDATGACYFALDLTAPAAPADPADPLVGVRDVGALLDDRDAGLLVHAVALSHWHAGHRHCPRCGALTRPEPGGHRRRCPVDGSEHYPRTDPAVIMAVVDEQDRILLGHQGRWPEGRFSTLAGFVDPGESAEAAVRREVQEETGVVVGAVRYLGSQPWPFPGSLMLGFVASARGDRPTVDGEEISEARWFTRGLLASELAAGRLGLPPEVSIARRLIEYWYGSPLPASPGPVGTAPVR
ncbi:MAG: NAD(+) diphosphatase [Actinomycetes bacterium]